ncbi:MAG TPA: glutamate formimidoyltransferase, partial [Actinobacteria bacterium]|nr:glutamate formimidoyltransferase [Actinomycetota bacterium]
MKLIECVPNFSEGRDRSVIDAIVAAIDSIDGVEVLDVDPGEATNRTVVTFVGSPEAVEEAALAGMAKAAELIDMRRHHGAHPRMGATDVCPFVPLEDATMDDAVEVARRVARRAGEELGIPVYLYEYAAPEGRRSLADVRRGEYEGLADREDAPDFGPRFDARAGATAVGARRFLIAYNVNLNTKDRRLAHRIAQAIRTLGTPVRDTEGKVVKDEEGKTVFTPGRFEEVKAVGWYIDEYERAQVSINLTDYTVSPIHEVFDACVEEAAKLGLRVTGSEIVGLVPLEAMLMAGDHYLRAQGATTGVPESERVRTAIVSLGLEELGPFDPDDKIVEYRFRRPAPLGTMSLAGFADMVSEGTPTPGGGSVAAAVGALGAALTSMVAALTHAKKGMEDRREAMETLGRRAQESKDRLLRAVDDDAEAFEEVLAAVRMPKKTDAEREARDAAMAEANRRATLVPLEVMEAAVEVLGLAKEAVEGGNPSAITDAAVAAECAATAVEGASMNVRINLRDLGDAPEIRERHDRALARARELLPEI